MTVIHLEPGESMRDHNDKAAVYLAVKNYPGVASKDAIAELVELGSQRVAKCIRLINDDDTDRRLDYTEARAKGGPYAGLKVLGWFAMTNATHRKGLPAADRHSAKIERGVRRSRLTRRAFARGIPNAAEIVAEIEAELEVSIKLMSARDLAAFEALIDEYNAD